MKVGAVTGIFDPDVLHAPEQAWKPLGYFNLYRIAIAILFLALLYTDLAPRSIGAFEPRLFRATTWIYLGVGICSALCIRWRRPAFEVQVLLQVLADILAITLLMHASGGVRSGFGMLLVAAVAGGSILAAGRIAILFAALASLAVLTEQMFAFAHFDLSTPDYPHAGMLGVAFFATAYLGFVSAQRIRASEALAMRRGLDLANLAQLNEHIIQRMQSGILAIDTQERIRLMNRSAQRLLGLTAEGGGQHLRDVLPEMAARLAEWRMQSVRVPRLFRSGPLQPEVVLSFAELGSAAADGVLVFIEDAAAINQRAQQLKLASLGRLTASIAHEIRNPLGAISHAGELLRESPVLQSGERRLTDMIRDNSKRVNAIIENVLQLSRRKTPASESIDLGSWLAAFVDDYASAAGVAPEVFDVRVQPSRVEVRIDPTQLQQVLSNLCDNALRHASSTRDLRLRGGIDTETERPYVEVEDNGSGIAPEAAEHIFEPFFTTRRDGTGLGLYMARELCESNQASLDHVPTPRGCRFRITFAHPARHGVAIA